jgi:hypothetical protein
VIDLGPTGTPFGSTVPLTRDIGRGHEVEISVAVTASFNNLTSLQVGVQTSPDNSTWTTRYSGEAVPLASLVAGYQFKVPGEFEEGTDARYVRLFYTVAGTAPTTGTVNAAIVASRQTNNSYGPLMWQRTRQPWTSTSRAKGGSSMRARPFREQLHPRRRRDPLDDDAKAAVAARDGVCDPRLASASDAAAEPPRPPGAVAAARPPRPTMAMRRRPALHRTLIP